MKIFYFSNRKKNLLSVWILLVIPSLLLNPVYGQHTTQLSSNDSILIILNTQRILEQLNLVQASLTKGDNARAFEHAYISHSIILPSIKDKLKEIDQDSTTRLESLLIDLPILVRSSAQSPEIGTKLTEITNILKNINSKLLDPNSTDYHSIISSTIIVLLNDASKFYELSDYGSTEDPSNQVDYENSIGMVDISLGLYKNISKSFSDSKQQEFDSFFTDLKNSLSTKSEAGSISKLITAIQVNLSEE